jgi:TolB protein
MTHRTILRLVIASVLAILGAPGVAGVVGFAGLATAADRPTVVVTPGSSQLLKVALQRFAGGPGADEYQRVLAEALEFSSVFQLIDEKAFLGSTTTKYLGADARLDCSEWSQIGADVFVEGALRTEGVDFSAEFRVWDLAGCERKLRKRFAQGASADPNILAKRMADDIIELFTGVRGTSATEISFVSKRSGNSEIFVMDADGANQRAATANRSINNFPSWSPGGDAIVYTSYRSKGQPMLYLSTRGRAKPGRILSNLSDMPQYRAVFAPSGREVAIVMSPKGSTEIYRVRLNGQSLQQLTDNRSIDISPSWSPDGDRIAFSSDRSGAPQVYVMDANGSNLRRLTFDGNYNTSPSWSPDGQWIAYQSRVEGQFDIWLIDPDGSVNLPVITHPRDDESPSWSPDSRKIAFSSTRRGNAEIYVADANGGNIKRLTQSRGADTSPSWGPYPR